jgi:MscS family membrane protein
MFGGFTVFMDQPFKLNERIKMSGYDGTIEEIGLRSTRLRTLEGRLVTIPNAKFSDSPVENVTREPGRKCATTLGLVYDTSPEKMDEAMVILRDIADSHESVSPDPVVGFTEFGDSSMNLLFIYWIEKGADIVGTQTEVNMAVLRRFSGAGLEMAFPSRTVYTVAA